MHIVSFALVLASIATARADDHRYTIDREVRDHACELLRAKVALTPETARRCTGHGK
jgi:hypothetical protein